MRERGGRMPRSELRAYHETGISFPGPKKNVDLRHIEAIGHEQVFPATWSLGACDGGVILPLIVSTWLCSSAELPIKPDRLSHLHMAIPARVELDGKLYGSTYSYEVCRGDRRPRDAGLARERRLRRGSLSAQYPSTRCQLKSRMMQPIPRCTAPAADVTHRGTL